MKLLLLVFASFALQLPYIFAGDTKKVPVVVITDLYHPYNDPGDNLDLMMGFALPQIDLKAIILDITDHFRKKIADHPTLWNDPRGPREAGIIPVFQLNYIFNRNIPFAVGPMTMMHSEKDAMPGLPAFQEEGINLLMKVLSESKEKIDVLSFGSARVLAVAYNRDPALLRAKIRQIHLSAGTASHNYIMGSDKGANAIPGGEWNVALDVFAFTRLLRSDLPVAIYPCAGKDGAFVKEINNTYWRTPDVGFMKKLQPKLQRYVSYAFSKTLRHDFLRAMDEEDTTTGIDSFPSPFHIWETAIWMNVTKLELVYSDIDKWRIRPKTEGHKKDMTLRDGLLNCTLAVRDDGRFDFKIIPGHSNFSIYNRPDPTTQEKALRQALPELYASFKIE